MAMAILTVFACTAARSAGEAADQLVLLHEQAFKANPLLRAPPAAAAAAADAALHALVQAFPGVGAKHAAALLARFTLAELAAAPEAELLRVVPAAVARKVHRFLADELGAPEQ